LKWLSKEGCPWNPLTFSAAAKGGSMEMLMWLKQEECPMSSLACEAAANKGNLEHHNCNNRWQYKILAVVEGKWGSI